MSVELYRESAGKFDSRTLSRKTLSRWTGHMMPFDLAASASSRDRTGRSDCAPSFRCQRDDRVIPSSGTKGKVV